MINRTAAYKAKKILVNLYKTLVTKTTLRILHECLVASLHQRKRITREHTTEIHKNV